MGAPLRNEETGLHRPGGAETLLDPMSLERLLLHGAESTRRHVASRLLHDDRHGAWWLLVDTVRSPEPWQLRRRCLEVLGLMAGSADRERCEEILGALCATPASGPPEPV